MVGKSSLLYVIGFAIIMGYIMLNLGALGTRATANVSWYNAATVSKNLAATGANIALAYYTQNYQNMGPGEYLLASQSFSDGPYAGGGYEAWLNTSTRLLRSVSTYNHPAIGTLRDTVEVEFLLIDFGEDQNSFTMFAYMTHVEEQIWWVSGEKIYGRLHTNGNLHVHGSPDFHGKVTVAGSFIPPPGQRVRIMNEAPHPSPGTLSWRQNYGNYHGGYESGVDQIPWPDNLSYTKAGAQNGGRIYNEYEGNPLNEIWVTLEEGTSASGDGLAIVSTVVNGAPGVAIDTVRMNESGFNGVLGSDGKIHVEGKLSGQLTIASFQNDIYITDNITYQSEIVENVYDAEINTEIHKVNGNDLLGLVAEGAIRISEFKSDGIPFHNPVVHASLFAREQGFGAENYDTRGDGGNLFVLGAMVQNARNPVGLSGQSGINGFRKHYMYDTRLRNLNFRPPFFPGFWSEDEDLRPSIVNWYESIQLPKP
jgi:cytoskeletal protein CcmA (bactofilin family)